MPESRTQPEIVDHKRTKNLDGGYRLETLVRYNISEVQDEDLSTGETYTKFVYKEETVNFPFEGRKTDIDNFLDSAKTYFVLLAKEKNNDLTSAEQEQLIDYRTGKAIDNRVHPVSGVEEQLGVLRYSLTELFNRLGETAPQELQDLNQIANEEIEEGQNLKNNL